MRLATSMLTQGYVPVSRHPICKNCGGVSTAPLSVYCSKACCSQYNYNKNPGLSIQRMEKKRTRRRGWLNKYKLAKGCEECGYNTHGEALHFDHIDQSTKHHEISAMYGMKLEKIFKEIRKCRVLCANCHAHHSKNQQNFNPVTGQPECS